MFSKSITIHCYTCRPDVYELSKIDYSYNFIPQWFKDKPTSYDHNIIKVPTIKHCHAIKNVLSSGFTLPLWSDLNIESNMDGYKWQFADGMSECQTHDIEQWDGFVDSRDYYHIKLISPFKLYCEDNVQFYATQPLVHNSLQYRVVDGIVNFKDQYSTHINMFIHKSSGLIELKHLTPMFQFIPLTNKKIKLEHHLVTEEEFDALKIPKVKFLNNFNYINKCPFKHDKSN